MISHALHSFVTHYGQLTYRIVYCIVLGLHTSTYRIAVIYYFAYSIHQSIGKRPIISSHTSATPLNPKSVIINKQAIFRGRKILKSAVV